MKEYAYEYSPLKIHELHASLSIIISTRSSGAHVA